MVRFAEIFPDEQIVNALRSQLSWTHFRELLSIEEPLKREFYAEMCRAERWSTRTLQHKIGHMLFERTAVAKKPEELIAGVHLGTRYRFCLRRSPKTNLLARERLATQGQRRVNLGMDHEKP